MIDTRLLTVLGVSVILGFFALTGFHALQEGRRTRKFIRDHEMKSLGMAVSANLDRTAAQYQRVGQELLRDGFLRNWILGGEEDERELRAFLEDVRARFDMMDASIVSDRTETYYGSDGRTLVLDPDNQERDGWYYLYRELPMETNIDSWYFPETGLIGMWINVPILDTDGAFLGVTGGGVQLEEFSETLHAFGRLPGINVYMARHDGQIVYARDAQLVRSGENIDALWGFPVRDSFSCDETGAECSVLEPQGVAGPLLWISYSREWNTFLVLEKTGEIVSSRTRATVRSSALAGGILTVFFSVMTLSIVGAARKRIHHQAQRLEQLAGQDALTGLNNRVRFNDIITRELARIERTGEESCLALLDLDCFKKVNDTYGHPVGDTVLVNIARVITENLRDTDHSARFGGEEFALLLPGTDLDGARRASEKIRLAISRCAFPGAPADLAVTASFGVASLLVEADVEGEDTLHRVYREADQALYRAKHRGRNRVETAFAAMEEVGARV